MSPYAFLEISEADIPFMPQNDVIPVFVYREIFDDFIYIGIGITFQAVIDVVFVAGRPFGGNGISSSVKSSKFIEFF